MLAQCPKFVGTGGDFAEEGTRRHEWLKAYVTAKMLGKECDIDHEDAEAIQWAGDYILLHAPTSDHSLHIEQKRQWMDGNFNEREGTPDYVCGNHIFDFKWRRRDYTAQMADYAQVVFNEGFDECHVHILFGNDKFVERLDFDEPTAATIVERILEKADSENTHPSACDYCGWCANRLKCSALLKPALDIVKHREGATDEDRQAFETWLTSGAHTSDIIDAKTMGVVLRVARVVSDFADAAEYQAKEMAIKQGVIPEGFKLQEKKGNRYITSVTEAFSKSGIPQDEFLKLCDVKFSGLVEYNQRTNDISKVSSEKEMERKLGETIQRKPNSVSLVKIKS